MAKRKTGLAAALAQEQENQRFQKQQQLKKSRQQVQLLQQKNKNKPKNKDLIPNKSRETQKEETGKDQLLETNDLNQEENTFENKQDENGEKLESENKDSDVDQVKTEDTNDSKSDSVKSSLPAFVPFSPKDKILLVGEGDFSFSRSILESGLARTIKPSNLDTKELLMSKYPDTIEENIKFLETFVAPKLPVDQEESFEYEDEEEEEEQDDSKYDFRNYVVSSTEKYKPTPQQLQSDSDPNVSAWSCAPLYKIDATQLHKSRQVKHDGPFDVIIFNFPHTGAGIKDQDRNVVQHQKLMLSFFQSCLGGVAPQAHQGLSEKIQNSNRVAVRPRPSTAVLSENGTVVVSLFEGAPYSFWDIRRLAREAGFSSRRTATFDWTLFPNYYHRLTGGRGDTTKQAGSRAAKFYVFERFDAKKTQLRLKQQETKRQQNKQLQAMKNNLKGKKGKRKIAKLIKKQKGGN